MAHKYMKKCSTSLAIRGMLIKTPVRFHLTLVRVAVINKSVSSVGKVVENKEPSFTAGGNAHRHSHYGKQYGGSKKFKNKVTTIPSSPSSEYLLEQFENIYSQGHMHPYVHRSILHSGQDTETTEVSFD